MLSENSLIKSLHKYQVISANLIDSKAHRVAFTTTLEASAVTGDTQ